MTFYSWSVPDIEVRLYSTDRSDHFVVVQFLPAGIGARHRKQQPADTGAVHCHDHRHPFCRYALVRGFSTAMFHLSSPSIHWNFPRICPVHLIFVLLCVSSVDIATQLGWHLHLWREFCVSPSPLCRIATYLILPCNSMQDGG